MVGHDLNLGALFALAYADEYPLKMQEPAAEGEPKPGAKILPWRGRVRS